MRRNPHLQEPAAAHPILDGVASHRGDSLKAMARKTGLMLRTRRDCASVPARSVLSAYRR